MVSHARTNQCNQTCGIDTTKPWYVTVTYSSGTLTISSLPSTNQGIHLTQQGLAPFDQWTTDGTADDRVFHTGDGQHILGISVNGGIANLCSGAGACQIIASYR